MKKIITPLITSALIMTANGIHAQSLSNEKTDDMIFIMDDNNDDKVDFKEYFEGSVTDNDDSFDVNKDGYITSGEVVLEIKEDLVQTIAELRKAGVSEKNINATIASELNTAEKEAAAIIKKMDTDQDNLVEPEELKAYKRRKFRSMDKNLDGFISEEDKSRIKSNKASSNKSASSPARNYSVVPYKKP